MLLDSPLCKSGSLSEIIISNTDGKLIRVDPRFRVPRSFKVFSKVFSEFLTSQNGEMRLPDEENAVLLAQLNDTIENYLSNCKLVIGISSVAKRVNFPDFMKKEVACRIENGLENVTFVIEGSRINGGCDKYSSFFSYYLSISDINFPAHICCSKVCGEIEGILEID
ncbi:ribosomal RNA small subunit methyltransferase NEP1-like [Cryptosporidium felis]|nr:ribosomal RNA small subunit methyltransferase NEP1-like [Cryptosporidium felis]